MFHDTRLASRLTKKTRHLVLVALAALLVACGGGGATDGCSNLDPTRSADLPGCTATAGTGLNTYVTTPLFTTAPSAITMPFGSIMTYVIDGGTAPYSATGSNTAVVTTQVIGSALNITGVAAGITQIAVVDSAGRTVMINVTVGTENILFTTAPSTIAIAIGNAPSYTIGGGTGPYIATSSNASIATVAVNGTTLNIIGKATGSTQIAIVDTAGKSVTIDVEVGTASALFTSAPSAIAIATGAAPSYTIGGGTAPYIVTSSNTGIATVNVSGTTLAINGVSGGTAQISVVDSAGKTVTINVTVGTVDLLFTTAPSAIIIATGATPSFMIGGGTAPYIASSSNTGVATASVSGKTLNINSIAGGTAQISITDFSGKSVTINVTVGTGSALFTTAPSTIAIAAGATPSYTIGGGTAPFVATSSNTGIATVNVSGTTLAINGVSGGTSQISVVDSVGKVVTIDVTVGATSALFTTSPGTITIATGATSNYGIGGGTAPFIGTSSNTSVVAANVSGSTLNISGVTAGSAQIVVVDATGKFVTINVTVSQVTTTLLDVLPNGATANVGDILNFRLSGGAPGYTVTVNNPSIATVTPTIVGSNGGTFTATLLNAGISTVAVVDALGQTKTFTLTVNQTSTLLRLSPAKLVVSESLLAPIDLHIYGGIGPYRAFTSDLEKSSVSIAGTILTIGMGSTGTRCFPAIYPDPHATYDVTITVLDNWGASATSVMTIQDNMGSTICP